MPMPSGTIYSTCGSNSPYQMVGLFVELAANLHLLPSDGHRENPFSGRTRRRPDVSYADARLRAARAYSARSQHDRAVEEKFLAEAPSPAPAPAWPRRGGSKRLSDRGCAGVSSEPCVGGEARVSA